MCVDCLYGPLRILTLHSIRIIHAWNTPCLRAHDRRLSSRPSECVLDAATTNWSLHVAGAGLARLVAYVSRTGARPMRPRNLPRRTRPRPKPMARLYERVQQVQVRGRRVVRLELEQVRPARFPRVRANEPRCAGHFIESPKDEASLLPDAFLVLFNGPDEHKDAKIVPIVRPSTSTSTRASDCQASSALFSSVTMAGSISTCSG
jgi:hypothetical protein